MVWGGHASATLVTAILVVHAAALIWLCGDTTRLRLIGYDFTELASEAEVNGAPETLRAIGYTEDDPAELQAFRAIAEPIVAGSANDGEKLRRLGGYIYALRRPGAPDVAGRRVVQLSSVWSALQRGENGSCGEMSPLLGAFWRSLGGHSRAVRWATSDGLIGHDAIELYSSGYGRWIYYDMNLNGYAVDDEGMPLSIAAVRSNLLTNENVRPIVHAQLHDWTFEQFREALRAFPVETYALNNRLLYFEAGRRFGALNRLGWLLARLPPPLDRVMDNLAGERDRRLVIEGKIEIAGLFTFEGARWFFVYLVTVMLICGITLARSTVRLRDTRVPPAVTERYKRNRGAR